MQGEETQLGAGSADSVVLLARAGCYIGQKSLT